MAPLRPVAEPLTWSSASLAHLALWITALALGFVAGSDPGAVDSLHHIHLSHGNKRHHIVPIAIHRSPASLRAGHSKYFIILQSINSLCIWTFVRTLSSCASLCYFLFNIEILPHLVCFWFLRIPSPRHTHTHTHTHTRTHTALSDTVSLDPPPTPFFSLLSKVPSVSMSEISHIPISRCSAVSRLGRIRTPWRSMLPPGVWRRKRCIASSSAGRRAAPGPCPAWSGARALSLPLVARRFTTQALRGGGG